MKCLSSPIHPVKVIKNKTNIEIRCKSVTDLEGLSIDLQQHDKIKTVLEAAPKPHPLQTMILFGVPETKDQDNILDAIIATLPGDSKKSHHSTMLRSLTNRRLDDA